MAADTPLASLLKAGVAGRRGERQIAANHVRAGLSQMERDALLTQNGELCVFRGDNLEHMTAFVEKNLVEGTIAVYTSKATWDTLNYHGPAVEQFCDDMTEAATGMQFIVADRGPFRDAVRAQARAEGTDVVKAKDAISDLTEKANALVLQAASLNAAPTTVQQTAFTLRYARLQDEYQALQARVEDLGDLLILAGAALHDVTT